MKQKQIILKGLFINYYSQGTGGAPIIFLHGWRSEAAVWLPLFKILTAQSYTLYALDLPGFGQSEIPKIPFTLRDYAEIVKSFISNLSNPPLPIPNVSIIGHSFGARVALKLASENQTVIQKLVLVGSGGARPWWHTISIGIAKLLKPFFTPRFMHPLRTKIYQLIGAEDYLATPALKQTFLNILNESLMPLCASIHCPTLIIWGEHDGEARLEYGKKMTRVIPNAKLVIIKNAGHYPFMDQPKDFIKILEGFINK